MNTIYFVATTLVIGQPMVDRVSHDFRGGQFRETTVKYSGPNSKMYVRPEPEGLRITVPEQAAPIPSVGIVCGNAVHGDFDITISYEILGWDMPKSGYGAGVRLQITAANAKTDGAAIARAIHPNRGDVYSSARWFTISENKKKQDPQHFDATDKQGKLRLSRRGIELLYLAAGPGGEKFQELRRVDFVADPIKMVRVVVDAGNSTGKVDVRVHDMLIRCTEVSVSPNVTRARTLWIWFFGIVSLLVGIAIVAWRYKRQRR